MVVGILILMLVVNIGSSFARNIKSISPVPFGNTLYVGGTGPNNYTAIQAAINDATNGDTVFVYDDSSPYYENIVVDKSISLIGENRNTTVIDGCDIGAVINITVNEVEISDFSICNGSTWNGINIRTNNNNIQNNIINNNYNGIYIGYWYQGIFYTVDNNTIRNNRGL